MTDRSAASARALLVDGPLALLVCLASYGNARAVGFWIQSGRSDDPRMGPPWTQPHRPGFEAMPDPEEPYGWALLLWLLIAGLGIAVRRIRPIVGYGLTVIGVTGYLAVGLPLGPVLIAPALALMAMATRMSPRRWAPWAILLAPMLWAGFATQPYLGFSDPGLFGALVLGGAAITAPALVASLRRNRLQAQHRARELDLRRAAFQERLKIARDVHDLIGHSLSVINMQAGVALYLLDKEQSGQQPADTQTKITDSVQAIRTTSKTALDELRATLAVFREEAGDDRSPVAGLSRLPELIGAYRAAGRSVELINDADLPNQVGLPALPGPIDNAAYRIIQEALTSVARHTDTAAATVTISSEPEKLIIDVIDDGPPVSPNPSEDGSGLIGMSERAEAVGGWVRTGPRPSGGFVVHAEFTTPVDRSTP